MKAKIEFFVEPEEKKAAEQLAKSRKRSLANLMETLLAAALAEAKAGSPEPEQ